MIYTVVHRDLYAFILFSQLLLSCDITFQFIISIWLNVGAMKLQYYEEILKCSSESCLQPGERISEESGDSAQSAIGVDNNSLHSEIYHSQPSSLTLHEWKLLQIVFIWMLILSTTSLLPMSKDDVKFIIGVAVNLNLIFFYAAPLSTIVVVCRTKSSSSIHPGTMIMNTVNSFFWFVYSLAIQDYYIMIPNGVGFSFGLMQVILYMCFPNIDVAENEFGTLQFLDEDGNSNDLKECQTEIH